MEWSEILQLKAWSPFSTIAANAVACGDGVYQVGVDAYVLTRTVNRQFEENDPNAPFVTRAYWSNSFDSVKRCLNGGDPTLGGMPSSRLPPRELLLDTSDTYGELLSRAKVLPNLFGERAIYSNKGHFLYKLISSGRFEYCFIKNEENPNERPFLIQVALIKAIP